MMDFVWPRRAVNLQFIGGRGHYETIIKTVSKAKCSVWIATANLKELMVEGRRVSARQRLRYRSILEIFAELGQQGVELRILHAKFPSQAFRQRFDRLPRLVAGELQLRECPRVHMKVIIVDGKCLYLGSANWTGAGLGAKNEDKRNFELGILTDDEQMLDHVQALYEQVWQGKSCKNCQLRAVCPAPLDLGK